MTEKKKSHLVWKLLILAAVLAGLVIAYRTFPVREWLVGESGLITWIEGLGTLGYLAFILLYILLTVLAGPAWLITLTAGLVYGLVRGTVLVSIGSILGASAAFLIGRYLVREAIARKVADKPKFQSIDAAVAERGFFIVLMTRLSPVFPFTLLNYAYGLTGVHFWRYFFASLIGMLPGTFMYVYIGSLGNTVSEGAETGKLILRIAGFIATAAVTIYITRIARKAIVNACPGGECFIEEKEE
ncbi:MAG: TVP38/TMEM64 family protein [Candidatus Erginobacter occultus]|nr:TVP38/TMEM64 family protein [Candidatus Erginobacter occultus]